MTIRESPAILVVSASDGPSSGRRQRHWTVLLAALLVGTAFIYARGLNTYQIDDDEEGYAYAAWRVSMGEVPYRDFLTPQLPGFLYPGALVVKVSGRNLEALRGWSLVAILAAATSLFVAGRSLLGGGGGLLAAATFLLMEDVYGVGRVFRPEALMLAATTAAMAVLLVTERRAEADPYTRRRTLRLGYVVASLCFGAGMLAKLFAVLPWAAAGAYVASEVLLRRRPLRAAAVDLACLVLPGLLAVSALMALFFFGIPATYGAVLGHHLRQGADLGWLAVVAKTLQFFRSAAERYAVLLAFVPAGIAGLRAVGGSRGWLVAWQFPTLLAFFLLSRDLFDRHLVVMMPAVALCVAAAIAWFASSVGVGGPGRRGRRGDFAVGSAVAAVLIPLALNLYDGRRGGELGTAAIASVTRALTRPDELVMADTPGPAFHAGRRTTYSAAGLSEGAAQSGQITGAMLLTEMGSNTALVMVDSSPARGHLGQLSDYAAFREALQRDYEPLGYTVRAHMRYDVFRARGRRSPGFTGPYEILGASTPAAAEAGESIRFDIAWRVAPDTTGGLAEDVGTFQVRLAREDGTALAELVVPATDNQGRSRMGQAAADEVLGKTIELPIPARTGAGHYVLRLRVPGATSAGEWVSLGDVQIAGL